MSVSVSACACSHTHACVGLDCCFSMRTSTGMMMIMMDMIIAASTRTHGSARSHARMHAYAPRVITHAYTHRITGTWRRVTSRNTPPCKHPPGRRMAHRLHVRSCISARCKENGGEKGEWTLNRRGRGGREGEFGWTGAAERCSVCDVCYCTHIVARVSACVYICIKLRQARPGLATCLLEHTVPWRQLSAEH